ncbi:(Fe-S)-binding protein [Pyrobaculum ferrireducens]|uniref:Iron-sulfur binding reductase, probable n=1 Tax=Pyrobaculum ferrireducens TaxID=1104324 RepID=G7VDX2_9CREN|nr:iron-sulfur binding reductase, probable [Pyrobaculum ferrireducens]
MINEVLLILFLITLIIFIINLVKRIRLYNMEIDFINLIIYEFKEAMRGGVGYMHFSIAAGIVLSVLLALLHPLQPLATVLWIIGVPVMAGLLAAAIYRVGVFVRSGVIHRRLGEGRGFVAESEKMQLVLLFIIVLTFTDIFTSIFLSWLSLAVGVVRNLLLAVFYVKPAANLIVNHKREITSFRTPFKLEDVIEGRVKPEDVKFGYEKVADVDRDVLLSCESCGEIGACDAGCPAVAAGRLLSPRVVVRTVALNSKNPDYQLAVKLEQQVWACTTCGMCVYSCPVRVNHLDVIYGVRRALVAQSKVDKKIADVLMSVSQYGNTMSVANAGRHDWLRELGVRLIGENPEAEYLLWVGCMGSFDGRTREIVKSLVEVLKKAGMLEKIAVLGDEETCCGDPVRRIGEESRFQEIVLANKAVFEKYGVKKLITICPHGYNVFKNEYPSFGVKLEVYHHSQIIQRLVEEGKIAVRPGGELLTIHDPCYLARYNKVVEPQRKVLVKLGPVKEPPRRGEKTFCCGAGGGNYWYDVPEEKRISHIRFEELVATGAKTIVTLCPFCNAMLSDAKRTKESPVAVKDLAEVIAEKMQ